MHTYLILETTINGENDILACFLKIKNKWRNIETNMIYSSYLFGVKYCKISIEYILPYTMYYAYNIYNTYIHYW